MGSHGVNDCVWSYSSITGSSFVLVLANNCLAATTLPNQTEAWSASVAPLSLIVIVPTKPLSLRELDQFIICERGS